MVGKKSENVYVCTKGVNACTGATANQAYTNYCEEVETLPINELTFYRAVKVVVELREIPQAGQIVEIS